MTIEQPPGDQAPLDGSISRSQSAVPRSSPWTAAEVAGGKIGRSGLQADGGQVYWIESRPSEGGRQVVVGTDPGAGPSDVPQDASPSGVGVRSRVHEYGGGAATVAGGIVHYVDQEDQAWYRVDPTAGSHPLRLGALHAGDTPIRHADGRATGDGRWWLSVQEEVGEATTRHRLVAMPADGTAATTTLVDVGGFVAAPRPSPDGRWLAWLAWSHPDMPWDSSTLQVAPLSMDGTSITVGVPTVVAGGPGVSVGQPYWCRDGGLLFVDDRSGWWLPYRVAPGQFDGPLASVAAFALVDTSAEFHGPDWVFGQHTFDELRDGSLVARMCASGRDRLVVLRPPSAGPDSPGWVLDEIEQPCISLSAVVSPDGKSAVVLGSTSTEAHTVLAVDLEGRAAPVRLSAPPMATISVEQVSVAVPRIATSGTTAVPGQFYAPLGQAGRVPPPLVVFCHGGPTARAEPGYDPVVQFFTSRGIAVASVDYRGSTGYGRDYRDLLHGAWGEADVDDCVSYAESLAADGLVDGGRMAIRGTSAGGLTALAALIRARCFAGAVAWYGVTDLMALAADTHDFESRYLDGLVGPLPDAADLYRERSPVHHAGDVVGRVLLLQGSQDPIVPVDQAERYASELLAAGTDCRLVVFEGESHGFRRADTIEAALEAELAFYRELFAMGGPHDQ